MATSRGGNYFLLCKLDKCHKLLLLSFPCRRPKFTMEYVRLLKITCTFHCLFNSK